MHVCRWQSQAYKQSSTSRSRWVCSLCYWLTQESRQAYMLKLFWWCPSDHNLQEFRLQEQFRSSNKPCKVDYWLAVGPSRKRPRREADLHRKLLMPKTRCQNTYLLYLRELGLLFLKSIQILKSSLLHVHPDYVRCAMYITVVDCSKGIQAYPGSLKSATLLQEASWGSLTSPHRFQVCLPSLNWSCFFFPYSPPSSRENLIVSPHSHESLPELGNNCIGPFYILWLWPFREHAAKCNVLQHKVLGLLFS